MPLTIGAALVALAIAVRIGAAIMLGGSFHFVDEAIYLDAAHRLLAGDGFAATYTNVPAYPVILAALASPWPTSVPWVRCAQAVTAGAGCGLLLALGRRTVGPTAALVAALFYALDPLLGVAAGLLYPESVAALLLMVVVLATWEAARDNRLGMSAVAGLVLGVLIQCRPVALALVPVVSLWMLWDLAASMRRRLVHVVVLGTCCLVALTPWALHNHRLYGHVIPKETRGLTAGVAAKSAIADEGIVAALLHRTWSHPGDVVSHVVREFGFFWELYPTRLSTDHPRQLEIMHREDPRLPVTPRFGIGLRNLVSALSFGAELSLAVVGIVVGWRRRRAATVLFLGVALSYALGFAFFVAKLRYRITVTPLVFLFAGLGGLTVIHVLTDTWQGARARSAPSRADWKAS